MSPARAFLPARTLTLAAKDLRHVLRDRRSAIAFLIMPILFTAFVGLVQRPAKPDAPPVSVGLVLEDDGWLGAQLELAMQRSHLIAPVRVSSIAEADRLVGQGQLAAAVVVPRGFTAQLEARDMPKLTLLADSSGWQRPLAQQGLMGAMLRISTAAEAAHRALDIAGVEAANRDVPWQAATARALDRWLEAGARLVVERSAGGDPLGALEPPSALAKASPGMLVMFAILGLIRSAMVPVLERRQGTLQRMLTTGTSGAAILHGHLLSVFAGVFLQCSLLVVAGQLAFGLDYLRAPLATVAMLAALSLWVASLGMFIGAFAKGPEQVVLFAFVAMIGLCALGGAWFPLELAGDAFIKVGRFTPVAWAMQGFLAILGSGAVSTPVTHSVLVLLAYSIAFFVPALSRAAAVE
jgi:ABC-2 type transport system permease protein